MVTFGSRKHFRRTYTGGCAERRCEVMSAALGYCGSGDSPREFAGGLEERRRHWTIDSLGLIDEGWEDFTLEDG